ncbi:MAG: hypothetical protein AAGC66_04550 [Leifsonia sp.]
MADEIVYAAGLLPSGKGKLMHVRKGATEATFHGQQYEGWLAGDTLTDGTRIFRRRLDDLPAFDTTADS